MKHSQLVPFVLLFILQMFGHAAERDSKNEQHVDFQRDLAPLFAKHCLRCHGPELQESRLRVDSKSSLMQGGDWGEPAIVPESPENSFLYRVVAGKEADLKMPPSGEGTGFSEAELKVLRLWIEQGASIPTAEPAPEAGGTSPKTDHWSFQPVVPPQFAESSEVAPIDALLLKALQEQQLTYSPPAPRRVLIRRLYQVMLGVIPSPEEVVAFETDSSEDAWERLVDRTLTMPQYGERWGRHWLDLIRFGETHGFETNRERPHAWRYRDWVIQSLNDDKPYDLFVKEQLAGDALGEPVATGFLVAGPHDIVKSPDPNLTLMQRQDELSDLINATGTALMGLTLGCARCHNHKFDPISQKDFYALQAVFAGVQHGDRALPLPEAQQQQLTETETRITEYREKLRPFIEPDPPAGSRVAVNARLNIEEFPRTSVKFVRFAISQTSGGEPCLDELEIFAGERNVALASSGAKATSSSNLPGYPIHQLKHIHDGKYGNSFSWISNEPGGGWVQIELPEVQQIDRIEWGRDRSGNYQDRLATDYQIRSSLNGSDWSLLASNRDRTPYTKGSSSSKKQKEIRYTFDAVSLELAEQAKQWLQDLNALEKRRQELSNPPLAYAGTFHQPGPTHRLYRGDPMAKREVVAPDAISVLGTLKLSEDTPEQQRRLAFAEFVVNPNNPLTARVIVNRLWQFHFGTGIVSTSSDFGTNGARPTHPELLDWLASELLEHGWSLKHLHRKILLSHAWQQSSLPNKQGLAVDAATSLLWRFPPRRLEAEAIRDCLLDATGVLDLQVGGPGFSGFEVDMENVRHFHPKTSYGPEDWRRMIYMTKVRQEQDSVFGIFDCPDASQVMPQRSRSTTPLQALNLLNSTFVQQQAELFSQRLIRDAGDEAGQQVERAFQVCFSRSATPRELEASQRFIEHSGVDAFCRALLNSNEFLFIQ